jgi:hypothetical protein
LLAGTVITQSNTYVLNENAKEKCCLGKKDECWLWNKTMGHINFNNIVKVNKREATREIPKISKPTNILCKHFL